ncbi:MAG TPA: M1 family aminopeptidase [Candidatus Acidoferrum sp.]|nr:M1 family aminopeptidase [Candidatus Acidoferrum sp.]
MSLSPAVSNLHARKPPFASPLASVLLLLLLLASSPLRADEPYARSRDYDLQHSRIALKFDVQQKKVIGDVTHSLTILRNGTSEIVFDSSGLTIQSVTVNRSHAKFEAKDDKLIISLSSPAHAGDKLEINIRYEATPSKGLYFILPDTDYPNRPIQIWTQGESQDTHFYLPTYDYPNDRLTTETILTVPESWITVANGKLISISAPRDGMKTWTWRESVPSSTYLITVVAGQFDEVKDSWHGIPVDYFAPKGRGDRLSANYGRTPQMIDLFSSKLGVPYPWEKYDQSMVDDFVAGGMENSSATTNTSSSLRSPKLVPEYPTDEDDLISHELGHQWFGDLVTCKDWGDVWLNEGFATFMETVWTEAHFGKDQADYDRWEAARGWFVQHDLFEKPIVRFDFSDSGEFDGNAYTKGGWVLYMLRHQLGDDAFYAGLRRYLEVNRGKNAVTSDLVEAIEQATHTNVDEFFNQWLYGAGAPMLDLSYKYDDARHQVALTVTQTQKIEGRVGLFRFPADVEITTASGAKLFPITVSKASEVFDFPSDSAPLMLLFDKGGQILKSADFHKDKAEWLYQLKHASELADRADAVAALAKLPSDDVVIAALGDALRNDKAWGIRANAADALGQLAGSSASKQLLESLDAAKEPWVRTHIVAALGNFKNDSAIQSRLSFIAADDTSYRARASALQAIAKLKSPGALTTLEAAVSSESPDDILRDSALRSLGPLGDDKAVPLLLQWSAPGKAIDSRVAAIASLARLDKTNKEITAQIASYLSDSHFSVSFSSVFALGARGDSSAIPALEAQLHSKSLSILVAPMIQRQIERLKHPGAGEHAHGEEGTATEPASSQAVLQRLDHLEHLVEQMNDRLKTIESRLPPQKK